MRILLTGASGFIGRHLAQALGHAGHDVACVLRDPMRPPYPGARCMELDFNQALTPADWAAAVSGMEVVINTVGILRESRGQTFDILHVAAPSALFSAAVDSGVRHIVQLSALGADENARTRYHSSKKMADDFLMTLPVRASIVQPSLVYGPGGASAALFELFASLPVIPLPGRGSQPIQPVHVDDLTEAVQALIALPGGPSARIAMVGPVPISLRAFYAALRKAMGMRSPRFLPLPNAMMALAARLGKRLSRGFLDTDTLSMLERGNTGSPEWMHALLGRAPKGPDKFVPPAFARALAVHSRMRWLLPILRLSVGLVWIVTGIVSLGLYPVQSSYELLARVGAAPGIMSFLLYGSAALDIALGALTLLPRRARWLWPAQAGLVLAYTAIISIRLPEFWLHPYGPILKNLPFLAGLWILYELEDRRWIT